MIPKETPAKENWSSTGPITRSASKDFIDGQTLILVPKFWLVFLNGCCKRRMEDVKNQRFGQQMQVGQMMIVDRWEWSTRVNTHWLSTQADTFVFAPKISLLHHISERDHVWISAFEDFGHRIMKFTWKSRCHNWESQFASRNWNHFGCWMDQTTKSTLVEPYANSLYARDTKDEIILYKMPSANPSLWILKRHKCWELKDWTIQYQSFRTGSITFNQSKNLSLWQIFVWVLPMFRCGWADIKCGGTETFWLGTDFYWSDGNYWDTSNQRSAPSRLIHNATVRWSPDNWQFEITGKNLWNRIVVESPIDPLNPEIGEHLEPVQDFGVPIDRSLCCFLSPLTWTLCDTDVFGGCHIFDKYALILVPMVFLG